jgi:hypothetical protein
MNRTEMETILRAIDPAADDHADDALRRRVLAGTGEPARPTRRHVAGPAIGLAVFFAVLGLVLVPGLFLNRTDPTPPANAIDGATFLVRYGDRYGGIRGAATDGERVWVMSPFEETLFEIPLDGSEVVEHQIGFYAEGVRLVGGAVWLEGWSPDQIIRFVPGTGLFAKDEITQIPLPGPMQHFGIVVGDELWNAAGDALVRIAADGTVIDIREGAEIGPLATAFGSVWAGGADGSLQKLDSATGEVVDRFEIPGVAVGGLIEGPASLWIMDRVSNSVVSVIPGAGQVVNRVELGDRPRSMTVVGDSLWVSTFESTLYELDAVTGELRRTVAMRGGPGFLFTLGEQLGVSLFRSAQIALIDVNQPLLELPGGTISDQLVELDSGRAVRLRCLGNGSPTVVLEADMGEGIESWATVQAKLGTRYRVCSSERSGLWMADDHPPAGSAEEAAFDLRQALDSAGEPGPFLLVGSGVGSWVSREFSAAYPDQVVGMVLVDPQPDDFLERFTELAPEEVVRVATAGFLEGNENTRLRTTVGKPPGLPVTILVKDGLNGAYEYIGDATIIASLEGAWIEGQVATAQLLGATSVTVKDVEHLLYDAPRAIVDQVSTLIGSAAEGAATGDDDACSATDLDPTVVPQDLPEPVATTRRAIIEAATGCDIARLAQLGGDLRYSFGGDDDPAQFWRDIEAGGPEPLPLETMVQLLALPFGTVQAGDITYYVWPRAFAYDSWDSVPAEDRQALAVLYDDSDQDGFAEFGAYIGYRIGITADGSWAYFVAGD